MSCFYLHFVSLFVGDPSGLRMSGLHSGFVGSEVTEEAGVGIADISTSGKEVPDGTGG